ncbi:SDR family NAD(P)-dependent oxidoreductase [Novosphingobium flavum]|uniref:SDR family NAD(P)-dependent oxidoreductase n=1 Tax=Novosphingobium aerophilum TaxID=2839843 RepID=A0A7X1KBD7_9SPHN|nr:SDR family NAD(P)-dependent oxidoreductase [Novosphingobium aerophilum]MBC2651124.1 SDR family NAD(P)-dependent oxidoreductase [Novosphingobium aerophilum]MBC2660681.1 SDR family NAD(P)-dependent oxidoreductase [Novosphingobium aerophilum]
MTAPPAPTCALITGGATGIGLELARQWLARGTRVIVCGRREAALAAARAELPGLVTRVCDVTDDAARADLVAWIGAEHPDLDLLVNNAGAQVHRVIDQPQAFAGTAEEIAVNLTAPILLTAALLPLLRRQPHAWIIMVSSGLAFAPIAHAPVYCAAKAGLHSFTLSLRHQLRGTSVQVVEFAPPAVDTALGNRSDENRAASAAHMMSAPDCVTAALARFDAGDEELLVGTSPMLREKGEALFAMLNPPMALPGAAP